MGAVIEISISYDKIPYIKGWPADMYNKFREDFSDLEFPEDQESIQNWYSPSMFGNDEDFWNLVKLGLEPSAKRIRGMPAASLPSRFNVPSVEPDTKQTVHVHVPNDSLLAVRKLTYIEDACTNRIQEMLNDDWKIVAVIPANDTRRPTYILGHNERDK